MRVGGLCEVGSDGAAGERERQRDGGSGTRSAREWLGLAAAATAVVTSEQSRAEQEQVAKSTAAFLSLTLRLVWSRLVWSGLVAFVQMRAVESTHATHALLLDVGVGKQEPLYVLQKGHILVCVYLMISNAHKQPTRGAMHESNNTKKFSNALIATCTEGGNESELSRRWPRIASHRIARRLDGDRPPARPPAIQAQGDPSVFCFTNSPTPAGMMPYMPWTPSLSCVQCTLTSPLRSCMHPCM